MGAAGGLGAGNGDGGYTVVGEEVLDLTGFDEEGLEGAAGGSPARRMRASMARAHWGTLEACLSRPTLPAMSAGAAKRKTCQSGKFQGMTARMTPSGSKTDEGLEVLGLDGLGGEDTGGVVGVVAADVGALADFLAGGGKGFAHLGGHEGGELFNVAFEQGREAAHPEDALVEGLARVGLGGAGGDGEAGVESLGREGVEAAEENAGGWIQRLDHRGSEVTGTGQQLKSSVNVV